MPLALPLPLSCPFLVWWWREGQGGEGALAAQAWGWVAWGNWRRAQGCRGGGGPGPHREEGLPCRLRHDGLRGGLVGVCGGAGVHLLEGMHHVHPFLPSRPPGPLHPTAELLQSGGRPPGEVGGGPGGRGVRARGPGAAGEDVDLRWWRGWRCLGERERRWRGLGVEDGYGSGKREGEGDMGRRWRARWRPAEREWWWRGLGVVDGYGQRGERGARRGVWGEGEVDVGRPWRASLRRGERWWRGLGVGVLYGWWGQGEADMGRRWRSWWCPGKRERRERGPRGVVVAPGAAEAAQVGGGGAVGTVGAVGECAVRGGSGSAAVCGTGRHRSSRASPEASAAPGGPRAVPPGTGGGGGVPRRPWIRHVGVWWRQRLVVWVKWLSLAGLGPGGPFGVDVVAGGVWIRFLVRGGWLVRGRWPLAVGGVCG